MEARPVPQSESRPDGELRRVVDDIEADVDVDAERAVDDFEDEADSYIPEVLDAPLESPVPDLIEQRRVAPLDDERDD